MRSLWLLSLLLVSLNCWAPHYTTWGGTRFEDWKIAPDLFPGERSGVVYSIHNNQIAIVQEAEYNLDDLMDMLNSGSGIAKKNPTKVKIYSFDGFNWNQTFEILEPEYLHMVPYSSPEEPGGAISTRTDFGSSLVVRDDLLFIGMKSLGVVSVYSKDPHPSILGSYVWLHRHDIIPNDISISTKDFGEALAVSDNKLVVQGDLGALFIYKKLPNEYKWVLDQEIYDHRDGCYFHDFDISGDILIVGSTEAGCLGKVWFFEDNGEKFVNTQIMANPYPIPAAAGEYNFGKSVSVDNNDILITHSFFNRGARGLHGQTGIAYVGQIENDPLFNISNATVLDFNDKGIGEFGWDSSISSSKAIINDCYFSTVLDGVSTDNQIGTNMLYVKTQNNEWVYLAQLRSTDHLGGGEFGCGHLGKTQSPVKLTSSGFAVVSDSYYLSSDLSGGDEDGGFYIYDLRDMEGLFKSLDSETVPAMGGIGLLALGLSMLGLGAVRLRKK